MLPEVDPMHNLFLGTAKHFLKTVWIERGIISDSQFSAIQCRIDSSMVPSDIGRIPYKVRSGFSSFTADQWKNWTVHFSLLVLHDILSGENLECWHHFVLACRILCCKQLTIDQVRLADALLLQFCRRTERMYGTHIITPNMHMHCHLRSCVEDYGPLHGFWLFAFERYKGILGKTPCNNLSIETQLMQHFLGENEILSTPLPQEFSGELKPLFPKQIQASGSLHETISPAKDHDMFLPMTSRSWTIDSPNTKFKLPSHCTRKVLLQNQVESLVKLYSHLHSVSRSVITASSIYMQYSSVVINDKQVGTHRTCSASSSIVLVNWDHTLFGQDSSTNGLESTMSPQVARPARINYFAKHVATINGQTHLLACVFVMVHTSSQQQ